VRDALLIAASFTASRRSLFCAEAGLAAARNVASRNHAGWNAARRQRRQGGNNSGNTNTGAAP
jgi:hypothetical protein